MSVRLSEVIDAMDGCRHLLTRPTVACEDGQVTLTLVIVPTEPNESLQTLALYDELRYVVDIAQMRLLCERHGILPEQLEPLLLKREDK